MILSNGFILSGKEWIGPGAVVIRNGKITAVSSDDKTISREPGEEVIDVQGRLLLPGLTDTHTHFYQLARQVFEIDLSGAKNLDEALDIMRSYRPPDGLQWITGAGWRRWVQDGTQGFDCRMLDRIFPEIPVSIKSRDLHTRWCNSACLKKAGIDWDTPDPPDGRIGRFPDGTPNGFLYERAYRLLKDVEELPPPGLRKQALEKAIAEMPAMGLTGIHLMESQIPVETYRAMGEKGLRFYYHFSQEEMSEIVASGEIPYELHDPWFLMCGMKLFMDGSAGSRTAWMFDPYPGAGGHYGDCLIDPDRLFEIMRDAAGYRIPCSIHAIGNRTVHEVLRTIIRVNQDTRTRLRHRIEHLQAIRKEDIPLLLESGAGVAMQPVHIRGDVDLIHEVWPSAEEDCYRLRDLLNAGVVVGFGSDSPVETIDPFQGIYSAIARKADNDPARETWIPGQTITPLEALHAYTAAAAKLCGLEHRRGYIAPGMDGDLTVLEDYRKQPETCWLQARARLTIIDGVIRHRDGV